MTQSTKTKDDRAITDSEVWFKCHYCKSNQLKFVKFTCLIGGFYECGECGECAFSIEEVEARNFWATR